MKNGKSLIALLALAVLAGCAGERPVKPILSNENRLLKSNFAGTYLFHKMATSVRFAGGKKTEGIPAGRYAVADVLVQFVIKENSLDVVSIDPLFQEERAALHNTVLASFPVRHVDVLRKQNVDGDDTHEEEETESRRPWAERDYIVLDVTGDTQDSFIKDSKIATREKLEINSQEGAINIVVARQLNDDSEVKQSYSFLKFVPSATYEQREYPIDLQTKFGFFKTQTLKFDKYGRITQTDRREYMNRWDTNKKIVYYLSPNYPQHLKSATRHVFNQWNEAFKAATGRDVIELRENTGQQLGDLRYSMVTFDETEDAAHGILGYGPSYANPRTGEIVKADVILYGGVLRQVVYRERIWETLLGNVTGDVPPSPADKERLNALKALASSRKGADLDFKLFSKLETLASQRALDRDLINSLRKDFNPSKMAKEMKDSMKSELAKNSTMLSEGVFASVREAVSKLSDEELEKVIFIPLLTHELGHNFGLRHNFMASADKAHFAEHTKSSSVMDYGFLSSHEGTEPGAYDKAAIQVGYGNDAATRESLEKDNFFFCTDEDTFSSQTALCNRFDAGITLSEIAANQIARYRAGFLFNNTRLDRVFMNQSIREYVQRVIMSLLPIRFQYDHSVALLAAIESKDLQAIYLLGRQRVEADKKSNPASIQKVNVLIGFKVEGEGKDLKQVPITVTRSIDTDKLALLQVDAQLAKDFTLKALRDIVLDQKRTDHGVYDQVRGELLVRGVIIDKMLTLDLLGARMPSPLNDGTVVTTFPSAEDEPVMPTLFRQVISNQVLPGEPGSNPDPTADDIRFDINLREMAIDIIRDELSVPSLATAMKKLLATERVVPDKNDPLQKKLVEINQKIQGLLAKIYKGGLTEEETAQVTKEINALDTERNRTIPFAQTGVIGDQVFKANIVVENFDMISASGLFILNQVNLYETIGGGMTAARELLAADLQAELAKPQAEQKKEVIEALTAKIRQISRTILLVNQIVELNRAFVDKMQKAFDPR